MAAIGVSPFSISILQDIRYRKAKKLKIFANKSVLRLDYLLFQYVVLGPVSPQRPIGVQILSLA